MRVLELFAGIGACSKALENLGIDFELVDAVEIDKYAMKSFNAIHGTNFKTQDITKWNKDLKDIDLITHGSPCQDYSIAGKQAGGDIQSNTRSSLMWETVRIIRNIKPKYILWENVKNVLSKKHRHNFDKYIKDLDELGYNSYYKVLNAKDYGVPQNRERIYCISIRKDIDKGTFVFPEKEELKLRLKDILEDKVDEKYYLSDKIVKFYTENEKDRKGKETDLDFGVSDGDIVAHAVTTRAGSRMDDNFIDTNVIGHLEMNKWQDNMKRIYDTNTYAPTINTMQGGNLEPKILENETIETPCIVASRGRNPENPSSRVIGEHTEQRLEINKNGTSNCLTTVQKDNWVLNKNPIRIRKLTPKECWRLMSFDDESFEKAQNVPTSNTQLYKQAGNSIVVKVLEKIFRNLFNNNIKENNMEEENKNLEMSPEDLSLLIEQNTFLQHALRIMNNLSLDPDEAEKENKGPIDYMKLWDNVALTKKVDLGKTSSDAIAFYFQLMTTGYDNFGIDFFTKMTEHKDNIAYMFYAIKCFLDYMSNEKPDENKN